MVSVAHEASGEMMGDSGAQLPSRLRWFGNQNVGVRQIWLSRASEVDVLIDQSGI